MISPYDPITGQWQTPFAWAPIPAAALPATTTDATAPDLSALLRDLGPNHETGQHDFSKGAAQDNGFNGQVQTAGQFGNALLGGAGLVGGILSGPVGLALGAAGLLNMGLTGKAPTSINVAKSLVGLAKGALGGGGNGLSSGQIEVNPAAGAVGFGAGNLAGALGGGLAGNVGDITGQGDSGNSMSGGGSIGDRGDITAEARGFAMGGYTGNLPTNAPAGTVHGQEFVLSAPATHALGVHALEVLNTLLSRHHAPFGWSPR